MALIQPRWRGGTQKSGGFDGDHAGWQVSQMLRQNMGMNLKVVQSPPVELFSKSQLHIDRDCNRLCFVLGSLHCRDQKQYSSRMIGLLYCIGCKYS